jgi:hypothetical protein
MREKFKIIIILGIVLFLLSQILAYFNTMALLKDLDPHDFLFSRDLSKPKEVQTLIEGAIEYGVVKCQNRDSIYYMVASFISLIVYIIYISKKQKD